MKYFRSTEELLDFAIREEEASASFYKHMEGKMKQPYMRKTFEEFSMEEEGHKANPHISPGFLTKRCRSTHRQDMRRRTTQMYCIYFKEVRLNITTYASVLCAVAVESLVKYAG